MSQIKYPHGFDLKADYKDYREAAEYAIITSLEKTDYKLFGINANKNNSVSDYLKIILSDQEPTKLDTSIGGNEVINPYPGGDPDDDIIFPINQIGKDDTRGLGHKYLEAIQNTQKIMWLSFGVPKFNNLEAFYDLDSKDKTGEDGGKYANVVTQGTDENAGTFFSGTMSGFAKFVGNAAKTAGKLAIRLPFLPVRSYNWVSNSTLNDTITKYYDFEPAMVQYYKLVNSIIGVLAVSMNLYGNSETPHPEYNGSEIWGEAMGALTEIGAVDFSANNPQNAVDAQSENKPDGIDSIPEVLRNGPDLYSILDKRRRYNQEDKSVKNLDFIGAEVLKKAFNWSEAIKDSMGGADQFIGFRIEKSTDTYETISNSTGEAEIAGLLNGMSEKMRSAHFSMMGVNLSDGIGFINQSVDYLKENMKWITDFVKQAVGTFDFGQSKTLFTGNGYFDIPEVWKNSSFTKSYTFSIELKSRLGDPISIYQNIYIPLACLLAAACPRAVGKNLFTSPFILQAYVQGLFAIPLGIIDNITLKRGGSDYGWSFDSLPTSISVSFSIKDLSPAMFLSLYGEGFFNLFAANSSMHEYLATLSGLGLAERKRFGKRLGARWRAALMLHRSTTFNPLFWSNKWGNSKFLRSVGTVLMDNKWPEQR